MVSTDDEEIAEIAIQYEAKVPFVRSNAAANDYAVLAEVVEEVRINYLKEIKVLRIYAVFCRPHPLLRHLN